MLNIYWLKNEWSDWPWVFVCPGDRLRGSEEELAAAVGAVGVEDGDSDWIQNVTDTK